MPGSTGPDNNTYTIPEVQLGDTFNFWRDATNTAIYKLNKLKIYDAVGSGSIGVTYGSTGAWRASLAPTITDGLTFTQTIVFSNGITAAGVYSSRGITAIAGIWTTGGLSADRLYVGGGSTFASGLYVGGGATFASTTDYTGAARFAGGLSAANIYGSGGSTFASNVSVAGGLSASSVSVGGGLSASSIYGGSVGSTFAGVIYVGGGATFASTTDHTGAARFAGGLSASGGSTFAGVFYVGGGATFASTASVSGNFAVNTNNLFVNTSNSRVGVGTATPGASLDVNGLVRIVSAGTTNGGSGVLHPLQIVNDPGTISAFLGDGTSTLAYKGNSYSAALRFNGANVYWGDIAYYPQGRTNGFVSGGGEFRFTKDGGAVTPTANAMVSVGELLSEGQIYAGATATINGNIIVNGSATFGNVVYVSGGATFASTTDHTGAAKFNGGATASTLQVTGNTTVGSTSTSATLGVCGSVLLFGQTPLRFADADSSNWVAFRAPTTVGTNTTWSLPSGDGNAGEVLFTNGGGTLSWKPADGATGLDRYVQYNQGGALGACAGFVFEYTDAAGVCSGSIGLSGGLYCNKTVAIGLTQGAVTGRLYPASTAKLEVRGDIRIPSNGFFVNKGMTLPSATEITVAADENAFIAGTLVVPSGATLTVQTGGYIVIL